MGRNAETLTQLILAIYRAAENPAGWEACLAQINVHLGGSGTAIIYQDRGAPRRDLQAASGYSPETVQRYADYFSTLDPWGQALTPRDWIPGRVMDGREVVSEDDLRKSEWFAGMGSECCNAVIGFLEPFGTRTGGLTVNRGPKQPRFGIAELRLMQRLTPHLCQALRLHRRLTEANGARAVACDALDRLQTGVVLVNVRGVPVFANAAATAIAGQRDGFEIEADGIRASTSELTAQIGTAVAQAIGLAKGAEVQPRREAALTIPRPSGRRPFSLLVVPAGQRAGMLGTEVGAAAAVFITDLDERVLSGPVHLAKTYGLTATETRVAMGLANGLTTSHIADELGISKNTARWHVKHVLHKTGVRTQAQFVRLAVLGRAALARGAGPPD